MSDNRSFTAAELEAWGSQAKAASARLADALQVMAVPDDIQLESVAPGDVIGENSLDLDFLTLLERGSHLNDDFLAEK